MTFNSTHTVAIVGRPNVGKSTLFNRLIHRKKAIVTPQAGGTRDRNYDISEWGTTAFTLIDTGGYLTGEGINFEKEIRSQVKIALEECDLVLFLVDCKQGITPGDDSVAQLLRKSGKPTILVANKADNPTLGLTANEFYTLGLEPVIPISATHGSGTGELMDAIVDILQQLPAQKEEPSEELLPRISFIGKPNVGKSTLMNALLNKERSIVSPQAHTTRDAVHSQYNLYGKKFIIVDTAGIYRKKKHKEEIEFYSLLRSVKTLQRSDVCVVVLSIEEGLTKQDLHIMQLAHRHRKGIVVLINKWDLVDSEEFNVHTYCKALKEELGTLSYIPLICTSGLKKHRIYQAITKALAVYENKKRKITTSKLNEVIHKAVAQCSPPMTKGKAIKINYAVQLPLSSPTFKLFCNLPQYIPTAYKRYLVNQIRTQFDFEGVPVTLTFAKK